MGLEPKEQRIYTEYWFPMENDFEQQDYANYFNRFIRDFLTIEIGRIPNIGHTDPFTPSTIYLTIKVITSSIK
jgi:uncharacterized protein with ParB-like and HNH nuclease domain